MSDQLYLSYWIQGFDERSMLDHFRKMLGLFPFSRLRSGPSILNIYALEQQEPPLISEPFPAPLDVGQVIMAAREFTNPDSSYQVESSWELWQFEVDWQLSPAGVILCCFGPQFENTLGDHLRIEFGAESRFLPEDEPAGAARMVESNVKSLLHLVHQLDDALKVEKRRLWTDSGDNFAERLGEALRGRQ